MLPANNVSTATREQVIGISAKLWLGLRWATQRSSLSEEYAEISEMKAPLESRKQNKQKWNGKGKMC